MLNGTVNSESRGEIMKYNHDPVYAKTCETREEQSRSSLVLSLLCMGLIPAWELLPAMGSTQKKEKKKGKREKGTNDQQSGSDTGGVPYNVAFDKDLCAFVQTCCKCPGKNNKDRRKR